MKLSRREWLAASAALSVGAGARAGAGAGAEPRGALGLVIHSFAVRGGLKSNTPDAQAFSEPLRFLEHARSLGAAGIQVGLGQRDREAAELIRDRAVAAGMYLEGIVSLPRDEADCDRFSAELQTARWCGAEVIRTVMLKGRRYETFNSLDAFHEFAVRSIQSLRLASPLAVKFGVRLAVENHKDFRAEEQLSVFDKAEVDPDHVGVCLDTGNSLALLEDPTEFIEALAPRSFTTHFKDMGVEPARDGFLLAEVPLGTGALDLPWIVATIRKHQPNIRFNLEMIVRDPLSIPCLTDHYWATLPHLPARGLARSLRWVRDHPARPALARISPLSHDEQLRAEDAQVNQCLAYARDHLRV